MNYALESLKHQAAIRLEELCEYLLPGGKKNGPRWTCGSIQGEKGNSFSVNLNTGVFGDYAVDDHMSHGAINLWMQTRNVDFKTACQELASWLGTENPIQEKKEFVAKPKAREPCLFPDMRMPTGAEIIELSRRRNVHYTAVGMAVNQGFLRMFDNPRNGVCWLWTDQRRLCGIRRRLDGKPFEMAHHASAKAASCPNSIMNEPLGYLEAASKPCFAVVEGAPDGLAVYDQAIAIGRPINVAPIVMPCSQARFTNASLGVLQGKRGRIFMDNDPAGKKASTEWMKQLQSAGITVDAFTFEDLFTPAGDPVKDLNDYCKLTKLINRNHSMAFALDRGIER